MNLCENIISVITKSGVMPPTFKITWCGNLGAYVEGVLNLLNVKSDEIVLIVKGGKLAFKGVNLLITSCNDQDLTISGKIYEVNFLKKGE